MLLNDVGWRRFAVLRRGVGVQQHLLCGLTTRALTEGDPSLSVYAFVDDFVSNT
jgi:hypothetical protein